MGRSGDAGGLSPCRGEHPPSQLQPPIFTSATALASAVDSQRRPGTEDSTEVMVGQCFWCKYRSGRRNECGRGAAVAPCCWDCYHNRCHRCSYSAVVESPTSDQDTGRPDSEEVLSFLMTARASLVTAGRPGDQGDPPEPADSQENTTPATQQPETATMAMEYTEGAVAPPSDDEPDTQGPEEEQGEASQLH